MGNKRPRKSKSPSPDAVKLIDASAFKAAPRKQKPSIYDPYATALGEAAKGQGVTIPIPEGIEPGNYRGYVVMGVKKALTKLGLAKVKFGTRISEKRDAVLAFVK